MIDIRKIEQEAALWGIPVLDRMELDVQVFGNIDVFGDPVFEAGPDEDWRGQVAQVLIDHALFSKAGRFIECCRYAHLYECTGPGKHPLFAPIRCDLRFCSYCAPRQFARLIAKYEPILKAVCARREKGFLLREITLTSRNTGTLTSEQIKQFNSDVKRTLKTLMRGVKGWGAIWCDEVGFGNTNLHAHILFYGPYISQVQIADVWREISGNEVVWISKAHKSGGTALIYMLKYVSKPPAKDPEQIGLLEVAFHGTRRVHALGVFYNFPVEHEDRDCTEWKSCPHCGAEVRKVLGSVRIEKAIWDGRT
ncbi:MAG: rolling circle replication-associated protein, partial [Terriglobia bacterium]